MENTPRESTITSAGDCAALASAAAETLAALGRGADQPLRSDLHEQEGAVVQVVIREKTRQRMERGRLAAYAGQNVKLTRSTQDALRGFGTSIAVLVNGQPIAGMDVHRLSDACLTFGHLVQRLRLDRYDATRVAEIGGLWVLPAHSHHGHVRRLVEMGVAHIIGMNPSVIVGFAVDAVLPRYQRWGFEVVGPRTVVPWAPSIYVTPIAIGGAAFARRFGA